MSKTLRGLIIYTIVLSVIGVVVGAILLGIMFFTANTANPISVFGYHVVSQRAKREDVIVDVQGFRSRQNIVINNGGFPVNVVLDQTGVNPGIVIKKYDNVFGIVNNDYKPNVVTNVDALSKTVTIDIPSLDGFVLYSDSLVTITLPSQAENVYNLNINSNSGKVLIDGKYTPTIDNVKQDLKDRYLKISNLAVETGSANFEVLNLAGLKNSEETEGNGNSVPIMFEKVSLKTNTGNFNFKGIENLKVAAVNELDDENANGNNFVLYEAKKTDLVFNNLYSPVEVHADDIRVEANTIDTLGKTLSFNSKKGYFKIKTLVLNDDASSKLIAERTNIQIETIDGGSTTIATTYGNINIGTLKGLANITTTEGNVHIKKAEQSIEVESNLGEIRVDEYNDSSIFKNQKGQIRATFAEEGQPNAKTTVETASGAVTLNNIKDSVSVTTTGRSSVTVKFAQMKADAVNEFNLKTGKLVLNIPAANAFAVTFDGNLNNVSGVIASENIKNKLKLNQKVSFFTNSESGNENHIVITANAAKVVFEETI